MAHEPAQIPGDDWVSFSGGELEGKRPKVLCPACREALTREASGSNRPSRLSRLSRASGPARHTTKDQDERPTTNDYTPSGPLCFQCYRAQLDREKALRAAGQLDTGSDERFQFQLPLEPVDAPRLQMLKTERGSARVIDMHASGRFVDKRRRAQIAARHALQSLAAGLNARPLTADARERELALAIHAAELQLPESWLPFVVSR